MRSSIAEAKGRQLSAVLSGAAEAAQAAGWVLGEEPSSLCGEFGRGGIAAVTRERDVQTVPRRLPSVLCPWQSGSRLGRPRLASLPVGPLGVDTALSLGWWL